jgi:hypothetical protein
MRNYSADNTADLSLKQIDTQESQPFCFSKLLGQRTTLNFDERPESDVKAYLIEMVKERDLKFIGEIALLSERLGALEEGRTKDAQCVRFNQTNEIIRRVQDFEGKMRESLKKLRSSTYDRVGRSDFEELATSQEREMKRHMEQIEAQTKSLAGNIEEFRAKMSQLQTGVQITVEKHCSEALYKMYDGIREAEQQSHLSLERELTTKLKQLEVSVSAQVTDLKTNLDVKVKALCDEQRESLEKSKNDESFLTETAKTMELYENQAHRLDLLETKVDEISNRMEDIEIRTLRLDIEDIIQKRDVDKDEFSEALATFGKQEEFRQKKGKSSPELVMMSLNDLGESDVESNGLMSPTLSPLNRFEQAHPILAARLKKFVFDDQHSSIEEAANEDETASPNYSIRLPPAARIEMSDRLMIRVSDRYGYPTDSEQEESQDV